MKPKGIIFQPWSVSAILAGIKTQTRRPMKPQPPNGWDSSCPDGARYGPVGRVLYVKRGLFTRMKDAEIWLRVTAVRAQRVNDISDEDAKAEGIVGIAPTYAFASAWDSIHGFRGEPNSKIGYGWEDNPWVWAYTFERIERPKED